MRSADAPTEHRPIHQDELTEWLRVFEVPLTTDEDQRLLKRVAELQTARE